MDNGRFAVTVPDAVWTRDWFWVLLALLSILPFVLAPIAMMPDNFSHIGRYYIMNHGGESQFLPHYYSFQWALIGNLGVDLIMVPLGLLFSTETAATIAAGLIAPLTIAGIYAVSRAIWGRPQAPALLALPFVFTYSFLFGFVNYHLAVALALLVFALWIRCQTLSTVWRWALFVPLAGFVWVSHVFGWAMLLAVVTTWELAVALGARTGVLRAPVMAIVRVLPLLAPVVAHAAWRASVASDGPLMLVWSYHMKLTWLYTVLKSESPWIDLPSVALLALAGAALLLLPGVRRNPRMMLIAAALGVCFLVLPSTLFGTFFYVDERVLPVLAIMFFLGLSAAPRRLQLAVATLGVALFAVRLAATTIGWVHRGNAAVAELKVLDTVPRGARIATFAVPSSCDSWFFTGYDELPNLAIGRREAFVNAEWDFPGQQLMHPIYNKGQDFNGAKSRALVDKGHKCGGRSIETILQVFPRDRFDYVWVFGATQPNAPWLHLIARGPSGRLYTVDPPPR
jgi:hypothetical protein